jgi:predicted Zn finger-like uncharacterized protein
LDSTHDTGSGSADRLKALEDQLKTALAAVQALQNEVADLRKAVDSVVVDGASRYVASCPSCGTKYDMLAHHYSIGLFDNMVYVKCPKCNKSLPVSGGAGGGVGTVSDEESR